MTYEEFEKRLLELCKRAWTSTDKNWKRNKSYVSARIDIDLAPESKPQICVYVDEQDCTYDLREIFYD